MGLLIIQQSKKFVFLVGFLLTTACATVVRLPANHFMSPVVQDKSWTGEINASLLAMTEITLVNDITTNPPTRTRVLINSNSNISSLFSSAFGSSGANAHLTLLPQLEINYDNYLYGLKWQIIGKDQGFVAAIQASGGNKSDSSSASTNSSSSDTRTTSLDGGISLGYMTSSKWVAPYLSFIYEDHQATTTIKNSFGSFSYNDSGIHRNTSLGIMKASAGFSFALEATYIDIAWNRSGISSQTAAGAIFGFRW